MVKPIRFTLTNLMLVAVLITLIGCEQSAGLSPSPERFQRTRSETGLPSPDLTPFPSITIISPTINSTASPTPLIDLVSGVRRWMPEPILIQAGTIHDLKRDPFDRDTSFVLYGNGNLIQKHCTAADCEYTSAQLNPKQICGLLNTIAYYEFFDYDPAGYRTPLAGGEITFIDVAAWQNQHIALYQLRDWLEDPKWLDRRLDCEGCRKAPEIEPALSQTYRLLAGYTILGTTTYQPTSLALWLSEPELAGEPVAWSLGTPSLGRLAGAAKCQSPDQYQAVVLTGSEAESVASYINQVIHQGLSPIFSEGSLVYQISTRWLLPYEQAAGCGESTNQFPSADIPLANEIMTCRISDGFIPTPTSTWIP
jgi:hypothetical protein